MIPWIRVNGWGAYDYTKWYEQAGGALIKLMLVRDTHRRDDERTVCDGQLGERCVWTDSGLSIDENPGRGCVYTTWGALTGDATGATQPGYEADE